MPRVCCWRVTPAEMIVGSLNWSTSSNSNLEAGVPVVGPLRGGRRRVHPGFRPPLRGPASVSRMRSLRVSRRLFTTAPEAASLRGTRRPCAHFAVAYSVMARPPFLRALGWDACGTVLARLEQYFSGTTPSHSAEACGLATNLPDRQAFCLTGPGWSAAVFCATLRLWSLDTSVSCQLALVCFTSVRLLEQLACGPCSVAACAAA